MEVLTMITIVAEHDVKSDSLKEALEIFDKVTETSVKAEGFISRQILVSKKDSKKITTITTWKDQETRNQWRENHSKTRTQASIDALFTHELVQTYEILKSVTV
jgi:quinol monooxygenase YgiN